MNREKIVPIRLIREGMDAVNLGIRRRKNILFSGDPGIGKSTLIAYLTGLRGPWEGRIRVRVVAVRLYRHQKSRQVMHCLCSALDGVPTDPYAILAERNDRLFSHFVSQIDSASQDLVIILLDECDYLVGTPTLDTLRDAYDECGGRLIFGFCSIGTLASRMAAPNTALLQATASRMAVQRKLRGAIQSDAELLADKLLENVKLGSDLIAQLLKSSRGSIRALLDLYQDVEGIAQIAGVRSLSLAKYTELQKLAGGALLTEEAPSREPASSAVEARSVAVA